MGIVWTKDGVFSLTAYESEADLERAILLVQNALFGPNRIYLDVKRKIGARGGIRNIPDGYLIDLTGHKPRLYVVENELAAHDPLRHIAVQILQFSLSFEAEPRTVKRILFEALQDQADAKRRCEEYAGARGFRNLDYLLEHLVFEAAFAAIVIIDEIPDNLQSVLSRKFQFGVEVIELRRYEDPGGNRFYQFEPFLADLAEEPSRPSSEAPNLIDPSDVDTVVVPARAEGMEEVFLNENRWYSVRIHGAMRPQIKYIAAYQTAPVSAVTHAAPVKSIEPWKDSDKMVVNFSEPAREIGPITLVKGGRIKAPQNLRYANWQKLQTAKTLDDLW